MSNVHCKWSRRKELTATLKAPSFGRLQRECTIVQNKDPRLIPIMRVDPKRETVEFVFAEGISIEVAQGLVAEVLENMPQ